MAAAAYDGRTLSAGGSGSVFTNCLFAGNQAGWGGGAYSVGVTVNNGTFVDNAAAEYGGGMYALGETQVTDCIVWGNAAAVGPQIAAAQDWPAVFTIHYSDVEGGPAGVHGTVAWGDGCIDANPRVVPGPAGCYYLSQVAAGQAVDSPCVDAGSDTAANLGLDTMTTRGDEGTDTAIVDMGYHYPVTGLPLVTGDFDRDADVDLADFAGLQSCFTGEGPTDVRPCCRIFDVEPDDDVDLEDCAAFGVAVTGP
jgi:hypothetical protein